MWSAQEVFSLDKSRRHLDRSSRDTWRDPIPSQNRESGVGRVKESALQKLRYTKSRNSEMITVVHFRGQVAAAHRIVILVFRSSRFSKSIETGPRNSQNRDTRYSDTISAVRFSGHVANIATHRRHFTIRGFKLSKNFDIAIHEIAICEISIKSQPSIFPGHVADIEGTISISTFGVSH
jgi:hypothetical protein